MIKVPLYYNFLVLFGDNQFLIYYFILLFGWNKSECPKAVADACVVFRHGNGRCGGAFETSYGLTTLRAHQPGGALPPGPSCGGNEESWSTV